MKQLLYTIWFWISYCPIVFGQNDSAYVFFDAATPIKLLESKINNSKTHKSFFRLVYHSRLRNPDSMGFYIMQLSQKKLPQREYCRLLYFDGFYNKITNNDSLFFQKSYEAFKEAEKVNDSITILHSLAALGQTYDYNNDNFYNLEYLNLLERYANEYNNSHFKIIHRFLLGNYYYYRDKNNEALSHFRQILKYDFSISDSLYLLYTYNNLGALFEDNFLKSDSAIFYYQKSLDFLKKHPHFSSKKSYFNVFLNLGVSYKNQESYDEAEIYYLKADSVSAEENGIHNNKKIRENLSRMYALKGTYKQAYENLLLANQFTDSLNIQEQRQAIANIKEQYDNEKLRADNLESETKRKQNRNLLFAAVFILFSGSLFAIQQHKITKRKQKLAEQEKELQTQKLATVLKEQELLSIDAMIAGQEKERQRIANDLHDDLGSLMTTVKWHFNSLKEKQTTDLFEKTNDLLDQAYQKIRSIAHAKNSGVIAKQGLLKAVKDMAQNLSVSNKINIEVIDHGLENRLENSLELTIFRVIQELITNVIKHAYATEVNIHLTNHDDSLNIMVEDNGIGFNPNQITKTKKGMGISSIDKRVEHLNGSMTIESEINKGTTIIIDIPI